MKDEMMDVEYIKTKQGITYQGVGFFATFEDMKMVAGKLKKLHSSSYLHINCTRQRGPRYLMMVDENQWDEVYALLDKYAKRNGDHNWITKERYQY